MQIGTPIYRPSTTIGNKVENCRRNVVFKAPDNVKRHLPKPTKPESKFRQSETQHASGRIAPTLEPGRTHRVADVPNEMHFIWFGGGIADHACSNILEWTERGKKNGWSITLWADSNAKKSNEKKFTHLQSSGASVREFDEMLLQEFPKARTLFRFAKETRAFAMCSDLARYAILLNHGGVYSDVDIAPGNGFPIPRIDSYDLDSIPAFAPLIRNEAHLRNILPEARADEVARGARPSELTGHDEVTAFVADYQLSRRQFGNHFIVTPPGLQFLNFLLESMPDLDNPYQSEKFRALASCNDGGDLRKSAACITGPGKISAVTREFLKNTGKDNPLDPATPEELMKKIGTRPFAIIRTIERKGIQWLTPESENQEQ
ncbi:glycosyltransferase [Streptomyces kronopolitis]|uniref:glycosyltransferase n=1 Tax=Streptomyces kronopolitis TaxID=1612435 RepID=UPI00369B6909